MSTVNKAVATSRATCRLANVPKAVVSSAASYRHKQLRSSPWKFQQPSKAGRTLAVSVKAAKGEAKTKDVADESPINAAEAIEWGQEAFSKGEYQRALDLFREVFTLPGSGAMRYSGTVREISCASPGEENAALYNIACCCARLGKPQDGLEALQTALENGFDGYENIKTDPDLAPVRQLAEFDSMFGKYDSLLAKLTGKKSSTNKKWWERW